jgi:3-hexulose-6-phosphate synthase
MSIEEAISIARKAEMYIDWIEVGTSLIKEFGMESVRAIKGAFPDKTIVADMKTFDNAVYEFERCFEAGADMATVMGAAPSVSIKACMEVAERYGKQVMIDLLNTSPQQLASLSDYENAILCAHLSKDQQESGGEARLHIPSFSTKNSKLAVAGGISLDTFSEISKMNPYVVIIGSAITKADDPEQAAAAFNQMKRRAESG